LSRSIYVSTCCFADRTPAGIRRAVAESDITHLEMSDVQASPTAAVGLARELRREGVCILLHNYFPAPIEPFLLNLASTHAGTLRQSRAHCARAIELSAELGAPFYAAHAGFALELPPDLLGQPKAQREFCRLHADGCPARRAGDIFQESVTELMATGRRCGVEFLIENHVAGGDLGAEAGKILLPGCFSDQILAWAAAMDGFGLLLDVGHLRCTARTMDFDPGKFCAAVAPLVRAFHLSDNNGYSDQHLPFDGSAWFLDFVTSHPKVPAILEFHDSRPDDVAAARALLP